MQFGGVPKYKSNKMGTVAAATSNKRKLDSKCVIAMPKKRGGLPREAKAVAGPVGGAEAGPVVGGAAAGPVVPKGFKALTFPQAKRAGKALEGLTADSLALGDLINEVEKEAYHPFLAPILLPTAKLAQSKLEEVSASVEAMMQDGWIGLFAKSIGEVQPARLAAAGCRGKLQDIVDEHRPVDGNGEG